MTIDFSFKDTSLGGKLITPFIFTDERGTFIKDFNNYIFKDNGLDFTPQEVLNVTSNKGVLRGMHFQLDTPQAKVVRCLHGSIYDVIVDVRKGSPHFGKWEGFYLNDKNLTSLYIPKGFAHGYLVLEDNTHVQYLCDDLHKAWLDVGIPYDDEDVNIEWPLQLIGGEQNLIISDRDQNWLDLSEYMMYYSKSMYNY